MNAEKNFPVPVPASVYQGLRELGSIGERNTWGLKAVLQWLRDNGFYTAADWVEQNPEAYLEAAAGPGFRQGE